MFPLDAIRIFNWECKRFIVQGRGVAHKSCLYMCKVIVGGLPVSVCSVRHPILYTTKNTHVYPRSVLSPALTVPASLGAAFGHGGKQHRAGRGGSPKYTTYSNITVSNAQRGVGFMARTFGSPAIPVDRS